jgi:hypothetical protein
MEASDESDFEEFDYDEDEEGYSLSDSQEESTDQTNHQQNGQRGEHNNLSRDNEGETFKKRKLQ